MKKSCLYFDKKYSHVSFTVHYKGLTLNIMNYAWVMHRDRSHTFFIYT